MQSLTNNRDYFLQHLLLINYNFYISCCMTLKHRLSTYHIGVHRLIIQYSSGISC